MVRGRPEGLNQTERDLLLSVFVASVKSRETWGYELQKTFKEMTGRAISWGTLFPALRRLEARALMTTHWDEPERGPRRRMYSLTDEGRRIAAEISREVSPATAQPQRRRQAHA